MNKRLVFAAFLGVFFLPFSIARADIKYPYVVDEKPQVVFGDSALVDGHQGLENYTVDYVGGYLHITYTYTHGSCCYAGFPPALYVTDVDPRTITNPLVKALLTPLMLYPWHPTGWYFFDIQFDATGYTTLVKEAGVTEISNEHTDIDGMSGTDYVALANLYPWSATADQPSTYSMSFTPVPVTQEVQQSTALLDSPNQIIVRGDYAYVLSDESNALEIIDISDPLLPKHTGSIQEIGAGLVLSGPQAFDVVGDHAYIGNYRANSLEVIDVSDPANPVPAGRLENIGRSRSVKVSGNYAYVALLNQTIAVVDVSDPASPLKVSEILPGTSFIPTSIFISGDYLYYGYQCSCGGGGMGIVDISSPENPIMKGRLDNGTGAVIQPVTSIFVMSDYAYLADTSAVTIVDVSNTLAPMPVSQIVNGEGGAALLTPFSIFVNGNYAYVTSYGDKALEILDVSNPASPVHTGKIEFMFNNPTPFDVFVAGSYAYVTLRDEDALAVVDSSNPSSSFLASILRHGELVGTPVEPPENRNPVLIVPGVLGTEIFDGTDKLWLDWARTLLPGPDSFLDPLQFNIDLTPLDSNLTLGEVIKKISVTRSGLEITVFDQISGLLEELDTHGYMEGVDVFTLPYDWRYGVGKDSVDQLKQKIQDIKTQTGSEKVDIIAHSTGGLLVKKYIIDNLDDHNIDKAVFVGVPNTGAPKAIKVLLQGDGFGNPFLADSEMKKLAENLPVVYDLAPSREYYNNKGSYVTVIEQDLFGTSLENSLSYDGVNSFLENDHQLNNQAITSSENLHSSSFDNYDLRTANVDLYNIVGCKAGTVGKVIEIRTEAILGTGVTYRLEHVPGDSTVPLESATNLPVDAEKKYYILEGKHAEMMTNEGSRQQIVNILAGSSLPTDNITQDISECKLNGKAISVFSPLSLEITDQAGNMTGLDDQGNIFTEIPNSDFVVMGEQKFVYLPTDEGQTYEISLKGTGNGTFTLENKEIIDGQDGQTEVFKDIPVTTSLLGTLDVENSLLTLDNNGDGEVDEVVIPGGEDISLEDLFALLKTKIESLNTKDKLKQNLLKKIGNIEKKIEKKKARNAKILERFKNKISVQELKGKITASDAQSIIEILDYLDTKVEEGVTFESDILGALRAKIQGLTIKQNQKNGLLKRVDGLENKQKVTKALSNATLMIFKKKDNGKLEDSEAQVLLDLLNQIESVI